MKLPRILADVDVPSSVPYAKADPGVAGLPYGVLGRGAQQVGHDAARTTDIIGHAAEKRRELEDHALVTERYVQARTELSTVTTDLRRHGTKAVEEYEKQIGPLREKWGKGLRPEAKTTFDRQIVGAIIAGGEQAAVIRDRAALAGAKASVAELGALAEATAGRLDYDDDRAFQDLPRVREKLDTLVQQGLLEQDVADAEYRKQAHNAAYARAYRLGTSDNPADVDRFIEMAKASEKGGDNFLKHLDTSKRAELLRTATGHKDALVIRDQQHKDRVRLETERKTKELSNDTKAMFDEMLTTGSLTLDKVQLAQDLHLIDHTDRKFYEAAIPQRAVAGGPGNPVTIRRLGLAVYDIGADPEKLAKEIRAEIGAGRLPWDAETKSWLTHLQSRSETLKQRGESEDHRVYSKRHEEAQMLIKELFRVTGPMERLVPQAQGAQQKMLEDLGRASIAMGQGKEDPLSWFYANKNERVATVAAAASTVENATRRLLLRQDYTSVDDVVANRAAYQGNEQKFREDVRRINDLIQIRNYQDLLRLQSQGQDQRKGAAGAQQPQATTTPGAAPRPMVPGKR